MSKQLYEEALADVKKLKEIAEDNAKKALIEAVSPRIKDLIEAELLREAGETETDEELLLDEEPPAMAAVNAPSVPGDLDPSVIPAMSPPDEEGKITLDLDALDVKPSGEEFELSNESVKLINPLVNKLNSAVTLRVESKLFQMGEAVQKFLEASNSLKKTAAYQCQILEMVSEIEKTYEYLQESAKNLQDKGVYEGKLEDLYKKLNKLVEQYNMKKNLKSLNEAEITLKLTNVPDEVKDSLADLGVDLVADESEEGEEGDEDLDLGGDEEEGSEGGDEEGDEGGDDELDLGGDEEESSDEESTEEGQQMETRRLSDNLVVEIDENMLRREIARMRSLREADETKPQSWGHGPGEVSSEEDFEADDLGDPFVDIDLSEAQDQDVEETDQDMEETQDVDQAYEMQELDVQDEAEEQEESHQMKQSYMKQAKDSQAAHGERDEAQSQKQNRMPEADQQDESDEQEEAQQVQEARRRLAREARIQTEAKKKAQAAKKQQKEAQQKAKKKQQEAQQKMKQKKQQEAQKAKQEAQKQAKQAKKMQEAYAFYANIFNESVRRTAKLQSVLAESRNATRRNGVATRSTEETLNLRKKLAETNLFNTKLLYCNKLLQNESLTKRQKAEIIERLDEANSEREVKLVYETLTKTLAGSSRQMTEGATRRVVGSSSQATRPASTVLSEGYEADRWAKLAGLK